MSSVRLDTADEVLAPRETDAMYVVTPGTPYPLGATPDDRGVNFSLFSENATAVTLLLFSGPDKVEPFLTIPLDAEKHLTSHFWHAHVGGLRSGVHYAYRVDGPRDVGNGHRFDPGKVLIDPYARGNSDTYWKRGDACRPGDNLASSLRSVVIEAGGFDWKGTSKPRTPLKDSIIYELHVGGFTRHGSAAVVNKGTFLGLIEKIPYLRDLGITAVELLPICEFDNKEVLRTLPDGTQLRNYWGYSTVGFFAPERSYCVNPGAGGHLDEFRTMVRAFHEAGIEVILDVVYNHTDEGNHEGPVFSFKGIDNRVYYYTVPGDRRYYMDYTGCGNTFNCNHPVGEKLITDSLRFWALDMQVDGFRFDEGSILSRGPDGAPMEFAPVLWNIDLEEHFVDVKLIAEAWDAGGLYEIGAFPGYRWAEWNGRFRDTVRRFVRGDPGVVGDLAARIAGSADLYAHSRHTPLNSINFVTCHDGFTMHDLTAYNGKHNEQNGEGNRDGVDENLSWHCGFEGATGEAGILNLRNRQAKNFAAILLLSQGVPMILMGDEVGRTQHGNNNGYCQDNELSWFDWGLVEKNADLLRFFRGMIALRKRCSSLRRGAFFTGAVNARGVADIEWHGCAVHAPGWDDPASQVLAFTLGAFVHDEPDLHVMMNMSGSVLPFELRAVPRRPWLRLADTSLPSPGDIADEGDEVPIDVDRYLVNPHSVVILGNLTKGGGQ